MEKFSSIAKHSQLLRNTRRSSLEDGIAPFFPRSDYNRCSFQIGGDDSQGYRTRAFPSRFLAIKVPPIYLSFQSFFFFFFFPPTVSSFLLPSFSPPLFLPFNSRFLQNSGRRRTRLRRFPTASHEEGGGLAALVKWLLKPGTGFNEFTIILHTPGTPVTRAGLLHSFINPGHAYFIDCFLLFFFFFFFFFFFILDRRKSLIKSRLVEWTIYGWKLTFRGELY